MNYAFRMASNTFIPDPSFNKNVPVVTANGGTKNAYNDPNSPESLLKKITDMNAQAATDTKYDVAVSPYYKQNTKEGFRNISGTIQGFLVIIIILFIILISFKKLYKGIKLFMISTACILLLRVIYLNSIEPLNS